MGVLVPPAFLRGSIIDDALFKRLEVFLLDAVLTEADEQVDQEPDEGQYDDVACEGDICGRRHPMYFHKVSATSTGATTHTKSSLISRQKLMGSPPGCGCS